VHRRRADHLTASKTSPTPARTPAPHPARRLRGDEPFIGRGLRDVWSHFNAELTEGIRREHEAGTTANNQLMMLIDADGTQVSELARRAQVTKQSMAQAVQTLESHGLVSRTPDPSDGRAQLVTLTPDGWAALRMGYRVASGIHARWTELLGEADMLRLVKLLERLADRLDDETS